MNADRRRFVATAGAAAVAAPALAACSRREPKPPVQRPPGVPLGPFGRESTAMQVTEGLDLAGRTALVTGATSGLGLETMRVLALRGAHVIATGRSLNKAKEACALVQGRTTPVALELENWDSVVEGSNAVRALGVPIDMLICNAGIMALPENEQVYGIEKHFVVNHLGHYILVRRLLEQVKAAPQGRVVMVSSGYYNKAPAGGIEFDNLSGAIGYEPYRMYGQSKLANGLFSLELAKRLAGTNATSNTILPGVINTNLGRHMDYGTRILARLIGWTFMKTVEAGAATQTYVATAPALARVSGYWFEDCNPFVTEPGRHGDDAALAAKLWAKSEELTASFLA
jgi:NAD(P)-dependent dehydrogenase (short-subunit alcohol dehydrogenase family)